VAVTYPPDFRSSRWSLRRARGNPLAFLDGLECSADDLVPFSLAGRPAFLLKHPDLVEAVLVTHHEKFTKSNGLRRAARLLGNGLLTADGERHRRQRSIIQPAFHRRSLERYGEIMVAHATRARDLCRNGETVNIVELTGALTLSIVGQALFGDDLRIVSDEVRCAVRTASDSLDPFISLLAPIRRVRPERARLAALIDTLIDRRLSDSEDQGADDLLSWLLAREHRSPADLAQARDDALTILLAGHETIASALVWTWMLLAQHPTVEESLEREVDLVLGERTATAVDVPALGTTRRILAESMRLRPPAWVIARTAVDDLDIAGTHIPRGATVLISQYLLHRDSRFFSDPATFDPDRWLESRGVGRPKMAFIPFGAGPRACIGEGFAWMEGVLLLATFSQRWRLRPAANSQALEPQPKITLRPPPVVRMTVLQRQLVSSPES
jgi:cytochrome P450